jgi:protein-L-isoaspartate O-methyltransferase
MRNPNMAADRRGVLCDPNLSAAPPRLARWLALLPPAVARATFCVGAALGYAAAVVFA